MRAADAIEVEVTGGGLVLAQLFGPYNASMIDHNIMRMQLARMPKGSSIGP